jgi:hypothetical protein
MDGIGIGDFGGSHDAGNVQVRVFGLRWAYANSFIGKPDVKAVSIGSRIDGHGLDAHLTTGTDNPKRYFSSVGYKNFFKHNFRCEV